MTYPYFVTRDPLVSLGKGFLEPGTYVSVYDANNTGTYRVTLPEAEINRLESTLSIEDRQTMLAYLTAKGDDVSALDTSNEKLNDLLVAWKAGYDEADAKKNKYEGFATQAKRNALRRLDARVSGSSKGAVMTVTRGEGEEAVTEKIDDISYVKVDEVANVANLPMVAAAGAEATDLPREETVYFGGQQWGPIVGWNPISPNMNNAMANSAAARGSRTVMFETLYMYNMLDGGLYPLLADGDVVWNDDLTEATIAIKAAAKWSDGTPVTADDVAATWDIAQKTQNSVYTGNAAYIDTIEAVDGKVVIKSKLTADEQIKRNIKSSCGDRKEFSGF